MLGFVRYQVAAVVSWQATAVALVGIAAGVPLGIATGRVLWRVFATNFGVVPLIVVEILPVAALALGVLVGGQRARLRPRAARLPGHPRPSCCEPNRASVAWPGQSASSWSWSDSVIHCPYSASDQPQGPVAARELDPGEHPGAVDGLGAGDVRPQAAVGGDRGHQLAEGLPAMSVAECLQVGDGRVRGGALGGGA